MRRLQQAHKAQVVVKRRLYSLHHHESSIIFIASCAEDTAVKPGHERESEAKDLCYLTPGGSTVLGCPISFSVKRKSHAHKYKHTLNLTARQRSTERCSPWFCSLHSNGILNEKIQSCSKQHTLLAHS